MALTPLAVFFPPALLLTFQGMEISVYFIVSRLYYLLKYYS